MQLLTIDNAITMTSLELVDFINLYEGRNDLTHANFVAKVQKVLGDTSHSFECDLPDSYGRPRKGYKFPKREACLMAMSYSYDIQAKVFDRMTELEQRHVVQNQISMAEQSIRMVNVIADGLNVHGSGRIGLMRQALQIHGPEFIGLLPAYGIDSPDGGVSSMATFSATHLLKKHDIDMSAKHFNLILSANGILEQKSRKSSGGKSLFWCVSDKGLKYGKNVTNEKSQLETQPHWYEVTFPDLLKAVGV